MPGDPSRGGLAVHPTVGQGTVLGDGVPATTPPSIHHLLVAPASAPSASKAVRWPMSGTTLPPVPGLSPVLATRCRGSPATGLAAAVSRDEEDAWKRSGIETQPFSLPWLERGRTGEPPARVGGTGWVGGRRRGHTDTGCFCFPASRCTWPARGAARQPAPRGYSWIRPMAPSAARQERLEGGERT